MLDRKTKNINAGVELLMDRKADLNIWTGFTLLFGAFILLFSIFLAIFDNSYLFLCFFGVAMLVLGCCFVVESIGYNTLIQAKKIMNCQQNQILLINEVLNGMDSLNRRSNVKKKELKK